MVLLLLSLAFYFGEVSRRPAFSGRDSGIVGTRLQVLKVPEYGFRQANPFFVEQARQPTHEPPDDFVDLVWSTVQLSQWGGKNPQLLVFGLVSSSYLSAASRDVADEQHNTNKSDVTAITLAHDGLAPTPLEFSLTKPFYHLSSAVCKPNVCTSVRIRQ